MILVVIQFMPNGRFYLHSSGRSISNISSVWLVIIFYMLFWNSCFDANSVDPDHTPHSALLANDPFMGR